jgi:hypothetical protein
MVGYVKRRLGYLAVVMMGAAAAYVLGGEHLVRLWAILS